jgi:hypothetical protein
MREKVKTLTDVLEDRFDKPVYSHRAGRWGFNEVYAQILIQLGYKVDCSVTPFENWKSSKGDPNGSGGPDFRNFPEQPYFVDEKDISRPGDSALLEIPVTIMLRYGKLRWNIYNKFVPQGSKPARFLFKKVFGPSVDWFRPYRGRLDVLMKVARAKLECNADYMMFMVHSPELMPGGSPQFRTEKDIDLLYEALREVLQWLYDHAVKGLTCCEYYNLLAAARK